MQALVAETAGKDAIAMGFTVLGLLVVGLCWVSLLQKLAIERLQREVRWLGGDPDSGAPPSNNERARRERRRRAQVELLLQNEAKADAALQSRIF